MSTLSKVQALCIGIMLIGFVWLTIDVFDTNEADSLQAAAILTWIGLVGNGVCVLLRVRNNRGS